MIEENARDHKMDAASRESFFQGSEKSNQEDKTGKGCEKYCCTSQIAEEVML